MFSNVPMPAHDSSIGLHSIDLSQDQNELNQQAIQKDCPTRPQPMEAPEA
jgi:hypothetical protein